MNSVAIKSNSCVCSWTNFKKHNREQNNNLNKQTKQHKNYKALTALRSKIIKAQETCSEHHFQFILVSGGSNVYCRMAISRHLKKSDMNSIQLWKEGWRNHQTERGCQTDRRQRTRRGSVLEDDIVWLVKMWSDGHRTSRCYLGGLWGKLSGFGSLDLFTTETRHLRSIAFVVQHAKHTEWTSFNSLTPPAGKVEFMSLHLSGVVSFYSSLVIV